MPARTDHLHLLRLNVAAIAGVAFGVDEVEDVKIAVEELAAALVGVEGADAILHVDVVFDGGLLTVSGRRLMYGAEAVELDEFVPTILDALVDEYAFESMGGEGRFSFSKQLRDG
ncbi:MAG: hypothetical protein ACE367_00025 [Acidimicrobiales bacterium]